MNDQAPKIKTNERPYQQVPATLSGGTNQKVAIAKVLLAAPVIILDEPAGHEHRGPGFEIYNLVSGAGSEGSALYLSLPSFR